MGTTHAYCRNKALRSTRQMLDVENCERLVVRWEEGALLKGCHLLFALPTNSSIPPDPTW